MSFFKKIIIFVVFFSWLYVFIRFSGIAPENILRESMEGTTWLYSTLGLIFGMFSGFIIQNKWEKWDNLARSVRGEIDTIRELLLVTGQLPEHNRNKIKSSIETYLNCLVNKESWKQIDNGESSDDVEFALKNLGNDIFETMNESPKYSSSIFHIFSTILKLRNRRLHYSSMHLPFILKVTLMFSTGLLILLSMLIYVDNIILDIIFKLGVSSFVYLIYAVIIDLDHPYRPGNWHLTKDDYKKLLDEIN